MSTVSKRAPPSKSNLKEKNEKSKSKRCKANVRDKKQTWSKEQIKIFDKDMVLEGDSDDCMDTSGSESENNKSSELLEVGEQESSDDAVEGPRDQGGFTILGEFKPKEKNQVRLNELQLCICVEGGNTRRKGSLKNGFANY